MIKQHGISYIYSVNEESQASFFGNPAPGGLGVEEAASIDPK